MPLSPERLQTIADMANDEWVDRLTPEEADDLDVFDELSEEMQRKRVRFLESPDTEAEELHAFAERFNWDCGCEDMKRIAKHPRCDAGTALLIYWAAGAEYYLRFESEDDMREGELETYELVKAIEERYLAGGYATARFSFDPRAEGRVGRYDRSEQGLPPAMYEPVRGVVDGD